MAIVVNGTVNAIPAEKLPVGYTPPTVTIIQDFQYRYDVVIPLVFSTTATSTAVNTMTAIVTATNSAVIALLALDFLATATVTSYAVINSIDTNLANTTSTYLLSTTTPSYLVSVTIFVKAI
jgi:hypothetical protein